MKQLFILSLLLACFCSSQLIAQTRAIQFQTGKWADIQQKAASESKMIFVDAYTTWCGPCKWMAKTVFTNDTVADYYNATFWGVFFCKQGTEREINFCF